MIENQFLKASPTKLDFDKLIVGLTYVCTYKHKERTHMYMYLHKYVL